MKLKCLITGCIFNVELLTEEEYKQGHPRWGTWDSEKCQRFLGRPKLFEGQRWCLRSMFRDVGLISISREQMQYHCPMV